MTHIFITCITGLEEVLEKEVEALGYKVVRHNSGGVYVDAKSFHDVYRLNYCLRTASRILWPLASFRCYDRESLYEEARKIDWSPFFRPLATFCIDSHVFHRGFSNSLYAAQVVKDAICDQLREKKGTRPSVNTENPTVRFNLFIDEKTATISFDTSGRPLHERGYRKATGDAPIRENLAAALLMLAEYKGEEVFCDPCAGSGTFLIEAAMIATRTPPQFSRHVFGFMLHPDFSDAEWQAMRKEAMKERLPLKKGMIFGIEKNPKTYTFMKQALLTAGYSEKITVIADEFQEAELPAAPNFVITNPPYGERMKDVEDLSVLYRELGDFLKRKTAKPARGFVLSGNAELSKQIGLRSKQKHVVNNGGLDCRLLEYDLF